MNIRKAGLLALLLAIGAGTVFFLLSRGNAPSRPHVVSAKEREERKRELIRIASIQDGEARVAELRSYVAQNPEGPFLGVTYNLLFDSLYATDKAAAMDLADRVLERYTKPEQLEVRVPAYRLKLSVLFSSNRQAEAAEFARSVLEKESDPDLLQFASQFDPANRDAFDRKITRSMAEARERARRERLAQLLGLSFESWQAKTRPERTKYLETLVDTLAASANSDPQQAERLPDVLRLLVDQLNRDGDGQRSLAYLDRFSQAVKEEDWFYASRGEAESVNGDLPGALSSFALAFSKTPTRALWTRVRELAAKTGGKISSVVGKTEQAMANQHGTGPFPPFSLFSAQGGQVKLSDLSSRAVLVSFFFPG